MMGMMAKIMNWSWGMETSCTKMVLYNSQLTLEINNYIVTEMSATATS